MSLSLFGGTGFVGSRYATLYPEGLTVEPRRLTEDLYDDALWMISTTSNYLPLGGDLLTDIDTNLTHTMRVLPRVKGVFNLISTWFSYGSIAGWTADRPARETDPCNPNGFYSATALCREHLVRSYCQTFDCPYRIFRLCNVIGTDPRASKQKAALIHLLGKVRRGEDVEIYEGDGYRNWLHVDDVCRAIKVCLDRAEMNGVVNIGAPKSERTLDLVNHAIRVTGSKSRVTRVPVPRFHRIVQTESFHLDTTRLQQLGFTPEMDAFQAVERVLEEMDT